VTGVQTCALPILDVDGLHHDGTFATMGRFLAFYNKPALPKTVKYVWSTDVDMAPYLFTYQNILDLKNMKVKLSAFSAACYDKSWIPDSSRFPILAGKIISETSVHYKFSDFEAFLNDILDGKYDKMRENILKRLGKEGERHRQIDIKLFAYGMDEAFVNIKMVPEFEKHRRLIYYSIGLNEVKYKYDVPHQEEFKKLNMLTWIKKPTPEIRHRLLELNEDVYQFMQSQKVDEHRIKVCLNDFQKYKGYIDRKLSPMWGLTVPVVVNAGKRE
jgi:uncharacterized protein Usg